MSTAIAARMRSGVLPFSNRYTVFAVIVLALFALQAKLALWETGDPINKLYLLMLVQLAPLTIALTRRHFTYISFILLNQFVSFSLTKYMQFRETKNLARVFPEAITAIDELTFCTILTTLVYFAFRKLVFQGFAEKERYQKLTLTRWQIIVLAGYIMVVPLFLHYLPAWFLMVHFMLLSADMLLLFTTTSPGNERLVMYTKIAAVIMAFSYFLNTGMMTLLGSFVTFVGLTACIDRKYWLIVAIFLLVMMASAIQSVKGAYRLVIRDNPQMASLERAGVLMDLLTLKYVHSEEGNTINFEERSDALLSGFSRVGDDSLERVLASTPRRVPFWNGESYASIPYMFIPRAFWHDKPSRHFWNKYGRVYGILSEDDFQTSVGVSYLAEAYMNFGFSAMYAVAIFMGFLIAFVERLSYKIYGGYYAFSYLLFLLPLLNYGSDLGSTLNSLFALTVVMTALRVQFLKMARRDEYC